MWASATASRNTNGCPTRRTTSSLPSSGRNWASSGRFADCPVCGAGPQGIFIALRAPDLYGTLLGIGIVSQVAWQVFLHIGVGTALLPNTGISLPFFSYGGTSLLLLLGEMGVLLSISRAGNAREERMAEQHRAETDRMLHRTRYRRGTV